MKITWVEKLIEQLDGSKTRRPAGHETSRTTRGRRRSGHNAVSGPDRARFRGPGRGKKDYPEGKNPKRTANGGRAD